MMHPERKLVDTRDKISFSLPKTLEAKEEQIREQTISISCCCCAFQPPLFSKSMRIASRILSSHANTRPSDRSSVRIEVGFVLFRNEHAKHHHRVHSKKREAREFCNRIADKKKQKKASLGVPRTKTSRVFGRPFLRWTRRSRSKFAKPISRNVVASSFRSWRPTLSRSCGWTGR